MEEVSGDQRRSALCEVFGGGGGGVDLGSGELN